jgi:hypothetical protein
MRLALLALALAGCPIPGGECRNDGDCGGGEVCANNQACLLPSEVHRVLVTWTIAGLEPTPTTCAPIRDLEVRISDEEGFLGPASFAPVPCTLGQYLFDKLPLGFDRVRLEALASGEEHQASIDSSDDLVIEFVLDTGNPVLPDAGVDVDAMSAVDAMPAP